MQCHAALHLEHAHIKHADVVSLPPLQAAWPNAAFDLCGICCGHFQMSFWQFFGATFIGKALIKVGFSAGHGRLLDAEGSWFCGGMSVTAGSCAIMSTESLQERLHLIAVICHCHR